jgi:hypothetical protein
MPSLTRITRRTQVWIFSMSSKPRKAPVNKPDPAAATDEDQVGTVPWRLLHPTDHFGMCRQRVCRTAAFLRLFFIDWHGSGR